VVTATLTSAGSPVSGASVVAEIVGPNGEQYWLRDGSYMLYDTVQGEGMDESGWISGPTYGGATNDGIYANFLELDANPADLNAIFFGNHAGSWTVRLTASKESYDSASTELTLNMVPPTGNFGHSFKFIDLDTSTPVEDWVVYASPGQTLNAKLIYDETNKCGGCCVFYMRAWGCPYEEWGDSYDIDSGCTGYRSDVERTWTYTVPATPGVYSMTLGDIFAYWWPFYGEDVGFVGKVMVGQQCTATSTGTGTACLTASNGTIEDLQAVPAPSPLPHGVRLPHGMFTFKITGLTPGQSVTFTAEFPDPIPTHWVWWKYHNNTWSRVPITRTTDPRIITFTLTDNVPPGDEDSILGQITDQGGPGEPGAVGWETYPVSKVRVLLPWIALFAAIAAGVSLLVLRRRRAQS
jgi:hypothetical protein